ncbi:MAG: endonuclease III [Halobacteriales archaeon]
MGTPPETPDDQIETVIDRLTEAYPDATISLDFSDRLELLIAVILSAQCTDERVNSVTTDLFDRYETAADYAAADIEELASAIDSITYYNNKAEYIHDACERIVEDHDGEVPDTMEDLTDLPGVGRKTANVVLQHGHDIVEGIVVDTHVQRLSRRLGLTDATTPEAIEQDLMKSVPKDSWQEFTHLLIEHGRATCTARNPDCASCILEARCPSSRQRASIDLASGDPWNG